MTKRRFRIAVVVPTVLGLLAVVAAFAGESSLPVLLQEHLDQEIDRDFTTTEWIALGLALPILAGALASFIGMLTFQRYSRPLSIGVSLVAVVTLPLFGPTVEPGIATALNLLSSMLYGAVIAISYYPPVSNWFEDKPSE
jgi:hypothetical protein